MGMTRRCFVKDGFVTAVATSLCPLGCRGQSGGSGSAGGDGRPLSATKKTQEKAKREPSYLSLERSGELARREEALFEIFRECALCPRECGVNRLQGETGACSSTARLKVHSAGPHFGEEPALVGMGGSGTIFFSNCNLLCCFCQNWEINHRGDGAFHSHEQLAEMMVGLQRRGCNNINLVTPTHVVPHIVKGLRLAIKKGLKLPLVYNTGGYDNVEVVRMLDGIVDIYLPDFKYQDGKLAAKYSSDADDYSEKAGIAIKEMYRQVGDLKTSGLLGVARRGLMLRHLVMPNNVAGTDRFVRWVAKHLSKNTYTNLMGQYHPDHRAFDYPEIARGLTKKEWQQALAWAKQAGLKRLAG